MKKPKKKMLLMIGAALVIVLFIGAAAVKASQNKQESGMSVKTAPIEKQDIESHILTSGEVLSIEKRDILPDASGKVESLLVKEGEAVQVGQALIKLVSEDLDFQLREAELRLSMEQDNLKQLKTASHAELEIALSNTEIQYKDAQKSYDNKTKLFEAGAISQAELDAAKSTLDQTYNGYLLAKQNLEAVKTGSKVTVQEKQVQLSQLGVEKMRREQEKYTIKSPIEGIITGIHTVEGGAVAPNMPVATVVNMNALEIVTNISEYDVHKIAVGQKVKITGDAFEGKTYTGKVKYIDATAVSNNTGQGKETVVRVKIEVMEQQTELKPGFTANTDILTESKKGVLVVPYEAIFKKRNGEKVIFTVQDGKAKEQVIQTGIESDLVVEVIKEGLKENDRVIMNPTENLKDGDSVKENKVMSNAKN